ncbi:MAG: hypothetical protein HOP11_12980 [Saprospiraceae bacterium]|nr:hypothetical protein [Saprospiraceae bacterium]
MNSIMKNLMYLLLVGLFIVSINSCTEDPIDTTKVPPTIGFVPTSGYITANETVDGGSTIKTKINATKGNSNLKLFTVTSKRASETAEKLVDFSTLKINGALANSNPTLILNQAQLSSFTYDIEFPTPVENDTITYYFEVEDENGEKDAASFVITTKDVRIKLISAAKLYNKQGPAGKGGLDLHTGASTGSMDATAELVDEGNNANLSYKGAFSPRSTETVIRTTTQTWDNLNNELSIETAFNDGTAATLPVVAINNKVYVIKSGIFYFAIKINSIQDNPSTTMFGDDYIEMDIKQKQ